MANKDSFFNEIAEWVKEEANKNIDLSTIGSSVKEEIKNGWKTEKISNGLRLVNATDKASFVEFGVGIVGLSNSHPEAQKQGYAYNTGSKINRETNTWIFNVSSDDELDIEIDRILLRTENSVKTQGSPAVLYAYKALVTAKTDLQNRSGKISRMWKEFKERCLK